MPINIVLQVNFPALTDLVAFLKLQHDQQTQIDALAAQVTALTARLQKTNTELHASVQPSS